MSNGRNETNSSSELSEQKNPAWALRFTISVTLLKWAAYLAPRNVNIIRMVTDMDIPFFLCYRGVDVAINAIVVPASKSHPKLIGEIYERQNAAQDGTRTILYAHGGAYCLCSPGTHRRLLSYLCLHTGAKIIAIDYRRPPEHPHPICRDDMVRAYLYLIENGTPPQSIVFAGDSAGGGLCVSALVALRDAGRPLPAGAALMSPWVDLSDHTGGTWKSNFHSDYFPGDMAEIFAQLVVGPNGDSSHKNLAASPIYSDFKDIPPILIESGGAEVLLGQISRLAKVMTSFGVDVDYKEYPGMVHFFQIFENMGQSEPQESLQRIGEFISKISIPHKKSKKMLNLIGGSSLDGHLHGGIIKSGNYFTIESFIGLSLFSAIVSYTCDKVYDIIAYDTHGYYDYHPKYLFIILLIFVWGVRIYQHLPSKPNYNIHQEKQL